MVALDSPRLGGGTLHFPSPPHHVHHPDPASAIRSLRRSLSRSPSKPQAFRLLSSPSPSPSPSRRPLTELTFTSPSAADPATPAPIQRTVTSTNLGQSSGRSHRSSVRKSYAMRSLSNSTTPSGDPGRRPLTQSRDQGNAPPALCSPAPASRLRSGRRELSTPVDGLKSERSAQVPGSAESAGRGDDVALPPTLALSHMDTDAPQPTVFKSPLFLGSSPLKKRAESGVDLDLTTSGSPVAKRRSLHGVAFGVDFNIFDHASSGLSQTAQERPEVARRTTPPSTTNPAAAAAAAATASPLVGSSSPFFASMPKRALSLRKSTLQQRHQEKPSYAQARPNATLAFDFAHPPAVKGKHHRMSLDSAGVSGGLPSASMHMLPAASSGGPIAPLGAARLAHHQPHPLSQAVSQSSSNSSITDEAPIGLAANDRHQGGASVAGVGGRFPPSPYSAAAATESNVARSDPVTESSSFATPQNYRLVKPLPAAFMSTGLISKRNRDPDEGPHGAGSKIVVPDTPCKRPTLPFSAVPFPSLHSRGAVGDGRSRLQSPRPPPTPLHPLRATIGATTGVSIFGAKLSGHRLRRSSSFLSSDGEDNAGSLFNERGLSAAAFALPPTPTKPGPSPEGNAASQRRIEASSWLDRYQPDDIADVLRPSGSRLLRGNPTGKSFSMTPLPGRLGRDDDDDTAAATAATAPPPARPNFRPPPSSAPSLFSSSRLRLHRKPHGLTSSPFARSPRLASARLDSPNLAPNQTKADSLSPTGNVGKFSSSGRLSPHTPQESVMPPDPSGLSISGKDVFLRSSQDEPPRSSPSTGPPATPTAVRDYQPSFQSRFVSSTPTSTIGASEPDASLRRRFHKVEVIGSGEFSQVYRVTQVVAPSPPQTAGFRPSTPVANASIVRRHDKVYAVKKSRRPYLGARDRKRKLQEVEILHTLGHSDHVVHLIDSWEEHDHLYIQTEFCEEGSLDLFLTQVGRKARLDDFRIWKIMLELCLGVQHIHDSGVIHLDLKPANVLITFEGVLKIADFGMASTWPAPPGIEGEGDREYIGPEVLLGQFDKPADIFALGLIMLEIAGNVELPENGPSWQKLRTGDMSDVPSLTWSSDSQVARDASGNPVSPRTEGSSSSATAGAAAAAAAVSEAGSGFFDEPALSSFSSSTSTTCGRYGRRAAAPPQPLQHTLQSPARPATPHFTVRRDGELRQPPSFMVDPHHEQALDRLVRWMISPKPHDRPAVDQLLDAVGVKWAESRRRAGAIVFEGNWGPADTVLCGDTVMLDV